MAGLFARPLVAVLTVLVLGAAGLTGWLAVDDPDTSGPTSTATGDGTEPRIRNGVYRVGSIPDADAKAALQAAVEAVPVAFSFDYRSLDESLAKALPLMTESFQAEYREIFDQTTRPRATAEEAVTTTLVRAAGVASAIKDDTVTCLVYLNQFPVASKQAKPAESYTAARVHVRLEKVDGTWKVDALEPF